jgi:large subunit ribosomal protein L13
MDTKTFVPKQNRQNQKWYLIDADGALLGRLAARAATILRGKDTPLFTPHLDMGGYVVVINAEKVALSGKKLLSKKYYSYSGYPGSLKEVTVGRMLEKHPERVIEKAVKGMLPRNRLGRRLNRKLFVYAGKDHPHAAQKPGKIKIR